jgi:hypothetical protein
MASPLETAWANQAVRLASCDLNMKTGSGQGLDKNIEGDLTLTSKVWYFE